jgi:hypothetical protein
MGASTGNVHDTSQGNVSGKTAMDNDSAHVTRQCWKWEDWKRLKFKMNKQKQP